jgi:hypothetical protein
MDFFGAQARARRDSRVLSLLFAASLLAVVAALNGVVLGILRFFTPDEDGVIRPQASLTEWVLLHPGIVLATTLVVGQATT